MKNRPTLRPKTGVLLVSVVLAGIVANGLFETPNVVGGGTVKMVAILFLMVVFKITIEFFLAKFQKRKEAKRDDNSVV